MWRTVYIHTSFTHLHKGRKTTFYTKTLCFVIALTKFAIWFWRDMWWRQLRATEKCIIEADWLKTTDFISGVPVLLYPSSPRSPLVTCRNGIIYFMNGCTVIVFKTWLMIILASRSTCPAFGYERVYLPLYKVADTPFHIQGTIQHFV